MGNGRADLGSGFEFEQSPSSLLPLPCYITCEWMTFRSGLMAKRFEYQLMSVFLIWR